MIIISIVMNEEKIFIIRKRKERLEEFLKFEEKLKTKEKLKIEKNLETSEKDSKKSFFPYGMSIC